MDIDGLKIIKTEVYSDSRGIFYETFKKSRLKENLTFSPVQSNYSNSKKGVLRGVHFSDSNHPQSKLLTCLSGSILDVVVDLRSDSKTYLEVNYIEISAHDGNSIYIPHGLGHSFLSLEENSSVHYLLDSEYSPNFEYTVSPFSKEFSINWPKINFLQSERDKNSPTWSEYKKELTKK